jgi:TolB protein
MPRFSPDGKYLAFVSDRGGNEALWLADANGEHQQQFTTPGTSHMGFPHWSPDAKQIVFQARISNQMQIFSLDVDGGTPRQITSDPPGSVLPAWSNDGRSIYFTRLTPGQPRIYQVSAVGGEEKLLSQGEGEFAVAVPGRNLLLFAKRNKLGIFSRPLDQANNTEEQIVEDYLPPFGGFYPVEDGVYYSSFTSAGVARAFRFYSFATRKSVDIAPVLTKIGSGLSVSPDRRRLAYCAEVAGNGDLIMLEWK